MAPHINHLPIEIFTDIIRRVRNALRPDELGSFVPLLGCCSHWHDVAKPILWTDVVLEISTLANFVPKVTSENTKLIRSLTVRIASEEVERMVKVDWETAMSTAYCNAKIYVSEALQALARLMGTMTQLTSFSFTAIVRNTDPEFAQWQLRSEDLCCFLQALPMTCASVELNTADYVRHEAHCDSLCILIRGMLPRLSTLRLRCGMLCHSLVLETHGLVFVKATRLKNLTIDLTCPSREMLRAINDEYMYFQCR